jgi:PAS domain S-box-containing protein
LAWIPQVPAAGRAAYEQTIRGQGFPKYQISRADGPGQYRRDVDRDVYYPISFIEPVRENQSLLGLNLASNPACLAALQRAKGTGRQAAAICAPLADSDTDASLLYVVEPARNEDANPGKRPADQPEADGFVLGVFRIENIVDRSLSQFTPVGIDLYITGPDGPNRGTLVYSRRSSVHVPDKTAAGHATWPPPDDATYLQGALDVADLRCTVDCVPMEAYLAKYRTWWPTATTLTGLAITGLVAGYLLLLTGYTARVERLVTDRTHALTESEERFRTLVDNAGDAFFLHDQHGRIIDVSRRACESLGYTRDELLSMRIQDIDVEFVSRDIEKQWQHAAHEYPVSFEGAHCRKDGAAFPVEVRLATFESRGRRLFLGLARDITERKRLEQTLREGERKLRALLDQTFQFIGLLTPEGNLTTANKTALAFSGVSEASVIGKPFWQTPWWEHSPALQEELREAVKRAAHGEFVRLEATHLAANGALHWVDVSLKPVKDEGGNVAVLIAEGHDITDRKRAEEAIREERRLLREMLDLHEKERKLVAYEIHDGLAQHLAGALYKFQAIEPIRKGDPAAAEQLEHEGIALLREAMGETRRLIGGLRPPVLDEEGIVPAIEYLVAEHKRRDGIEVEFTHDPDIERMAPPLEAALFRIVQESLTNACRYSQSRKVSVELRRNNGRVQVDVRDSGVGRRAERPFRPAGNSRAGSAAGRNGRHRNGAKTWHARRRRPSVDAQGRKRKCPMIRRLSPGQQNGRRQS